MGKQLSERQQKAQVVHLFQDGQYFYKRGLKAYRQQNLTRASKLLQRAVTLEPDNPMMLSGLAVIYTEMGQYQQSNELLTYILEQVEAEMTDCHYFIANNYAHLGLFHEAYKYATKYAEVEPNGEFAEDNADLLELLSIEGEENEDGCYDQDDLIVKQDEAKSLLEKGKLDEAIEQLQKIIKEYPEFWSAYNNLSLAYFYLGDVEKAKDYLEIVLDRSPGNLHALCNLIVFYYYEKQDDKVDELTKNLSAVHPILFEHRYKLGATFALVGRYPQAYKWLKSLYRLGFEGDDTFYYWLSHSAYYIGHEDFAKMLWNKVVELNPSKQGTEPWQELEQDFFDQLTIEERLASIFFASQMKKLEKISEFKPKDMFEKEFISYALGFQSGRTEGACAYSAAETLYKHGLQSIQKEELYLFFFQVIEKGKEAGFPLKNYRAWAAAVHYIWEKNQRNSVTKASIADMYTISSSTLSKYEKIIRDLM
ncbi:tetratricopeptide repeat protein [Metabacillus arenae]|uniref:Tetratricopeptide repeat protein n=1 Tax=Metabacillus arenae TaxID=2771434 RepID=A0A926NIN5_9BACI|nr:tetratricopeptide repeat protein [Metabacillus arenae]MBD1381465.1 tetratricopeptide repeat protein [Metabacillus arenae]